MARITPEKEKAIAADLGRGHTISQIRRNHGVSWAVVKRIQRDISTLLGNPPPGEGVSLDNPAAIRLDLGSQAIALARQYMGQARVSRDTREQASLARTGGVWLEKAMKFLGTQDGSKDMDLEAYIIALEAEEQAGSVPIV